MLVCFIQFIILEDYTKELFILEIFFESYFVFSCKLFEIEKLPL